MKYSSLIITLSFLICIILSGTASAESSVSINIQSGYTDASGQTITSAIPGDTIYELINVVSSTDATGGLLITDITDPILTYTGNYYISYDNQASWILNEGSYTPNVGWTITNMNNGDSYWLKKEFTVIQEDPEDVDPVTLNMPETQMSQVPQTMTIPISSNTIMNTDSQLTKKSVYKNHPTRTSNTLNKFTALSAAKLNPTYYAALLRMNK